MKHRDEDSPRHYEHEVLEDMIHLDNKKLRNFNEEGVRDCSTGNRHKSAGSHSMDAAIDDYLRYLVVSKMEDETAESVTKHLIE